MSLPHVQIGDDLLDDALLASVQITQELNQHWRCAIVCRQTEDKQIPVEDFLGKSIDIKTTDDQGVEYTHFSGFVHDVGLNLEIHGSFTAQLHAISSSYVMDVSPLKQYYAEQTISAIASTLAGRADLAVSVNTADRKALNYVQHGETDFSFLHRLVDDHCAWMRPKKDGIEIFDSFQSGSTVEWRGEGDLTDFHVRGALAPTSFNGTHYDHHARQSNSFEKVSSPPEFYDSAQRLTSAVQSASKMLPAGFEPGRSRAKTLSDYQTQLEDESERSIGGSIIGTGHSRNQTLTAGNTIQINGDLSVEGTYGLIKVEHRWEQRGYLNSFTCTPWKKYRNPQPPAMQTWNGVVSAHVVDHNDPKNMGRLRIQYIWQGEGSTHWARMSTPSAGKDRGFMFMPEIGDEVAVAFEDGDPERPIIMNSLWNGEHQAPRYNFRGEDIAANDVKRLVTKAGNRIQLSDKTGKETVLLATPHHTSLSMTEQSDETGRNLIILHSDGDIVLNAPNGRVHINSQFFSSEVNQPSTVGSTGSDSKSTSSHSSRLPTNQATGLGNAVSAVGSGHKTTTITYKDGTQETRHGSRAWRNNNPGNIEIPSGSKNSFAMSHGAIGKEGNVYAVFPDAQTGRNALHDLLKTPKYQSLTIGDAMKRFAPAEDNNNPAAYANSLSKAVQVPVDTRLSDLNDDQLSTLMNKIGNVEGYNLGETSKVIPLSGVSQ